MRFVIDKEGTDVDYVYGVNSLNLTSFDDTVNMTVPQSHGLFINGEGGLGHDIVSYTSISEAMGGIDVKVSAQGASVEAMGQNGGTPDQFINFDEIRGTQSNDTFEVANLGTIATLDGSGGNDTTDFSTFTGSGINLSISGDGNFLVTSTQSPSVPVETLVSMEKIIGTPGDDVFHLNQVTGDTFIGFGGSDIADYSGVTLVGPDPYVDGGIFVSEYENGATVYMPYLSSSPVDNLIGVNTIVGTSGGDSFYGVNGTFADSGHLVYQGEGGDDAYVFNLNQDHGLVEISEVGSTPFSSGINVDGVVDGQTCLTWHNIPDSGNIDLTFSNTGSDGDIITIRLNETAIMNGTSSLQDISMGGYIYYLHDLVTYLTAFPGTENQNLVLNSADGSTSLWYAMEGYLHGNGAFPAPAGPTPIPAPPIPGGPENPGGSVFLPDPPNPEGPNYVPPSVGEPVYYNPIQTDHYVYYVDDDGEPEDTPIIELQAARTADQLASLEQEVAIYDSDNDGTFYTADSYATLVEGINLYATQKDVSIQWGGPVNDLLNVSIDGRPVCSFSNFNSGTSISGIGAMSSTDFGAFSGGSYSSSSAGNFTITHQGINSSLDPAINVTYHMSYLAFAGGGVWNLQGPLTFTADAGGSDLFTRPGIDDTLQGLGGNDEMFGNTGNDVLIGGQGADVMVGGLGNDTYVFSPGDSPISLGGDNIQESSNQGTDTIVLHGVTPADVKFWDDASGHLFIQQSPTDLITVTGGTFDGTGVSPTIEKIVFDNGAVWDLTQGLHLIANDAGQGLQGTASNDILEGGAGTDVVFGYAGNDTVIGHGGTDNLLGGTGDDTYVFNPGDSPILAGGDQIVEQADQGTDTILLHGVNPGDVKIWDDASGKLFIEYTSNDLITVGGGTYSNTAGETFTVEKVSFDDGTVWDLTQGVHLVANDTAQGLLGTALDDTLEGGASDDVVNGFAGDDTLVGHAGTDNLMGGSGDDTYVFNPGDSPVSRGGDAIFEQPGEGTDTIQLHGVNPGDVSIWDDSSGKLYIQYTATDLITVTGGTFSSTSGETPSIEKIAFDDGTVWDLTGNLTLVANNAGQVLLGGAGNDTLIGGTGADQLSGYTGNDWLIAGGGNDLLTGGAGADHFVFKAATAFLPGTPEITDFTPSQGDVIDLRDLLPAFDPTTDNISNFVEIDNYFGLGMLYVDTDGPGTAHGWQLIAELSGGGGLNASSLLASGNLLVANHAPVAQTDNFTVNEDTVLTGNVLADNGNGADFDPDSDPFSVVGAPLPRRTGERSR